MPDPATPDPATPDFDAPDPDAEPSEESGAGYGNHAPPEEDGD